MNSLFGELFRIFGQILGQILTRFWARFWARFLARFFGTRKYSVQFYWDRENTVYSSTGTEKIQYYSTIFYLLFNFQQILKSILPTIEYYLNPPTPTAVGVLEQTFAAISWCQIQR